MGCLIVIHTHTNTCRIIHIPFLVDGRSEQRVELVVLNVDGEAAAVAMLQEGYGSNGLSLSSSHIYVKEMY